MEDPRLNETLIRQMFFVEMARSLTGTKPAHRPTREHQLHLHQQEALSDDGSQLRLRQSVTTLTYSPCTQSALSLRRIPLTELLLETVHRGKFLLLKTLAVPNKTVAIKTIVEDPEGNVDVLSLYNYAIDRPYTDAIPMNSFLIIKEPYYKMTAGGGASIRCDHPTDALLLDLDDPLVQGTKWKSSVPKAISNTSSVGDYRIEGNSYFKQGKFYHAIRVYSKGISSPTCTKSEALFLKLNRAQTHLKLNHFQAALDDSRQVLAVEPENVKALYRSLKALYGLEEYEEALHQTQILLKINPANIDGQAELKNITVRLDEKQKGVYDFHTMIIEAKKSFTPRLDHASYTGPVRIAVLSKNRGRGLVLTENVRRGQLLLCSKAFAISYPSEVGDFLYINTATNLSVRGTQGAIISQIVHKLINNPTLAPSFFDLYAGMSRQGKQPPPAWEAVDTFWVADVCVMNEFGTSDTDLYPSLDGEPQSDVMATKGSDTPTALFLMPSYINHSCQENCMRTFIGDMLILRALYDLNEGAELVMPYTDASLELEERLETLKKHDFVCDCTLCTLDRAESGKIRKCRKLALDKFQNEIKPKMQLEFQRDPQKAINDVLAIVKRIEDTYKASRREKYRLSLCKPLMALGNMYGGQMDIQNAMITYKRVLELHGFDTSPDNSNVWSLVLFSSIVQLCLLYFSTGQTTLGNQLLKKLREHLVITAGGDDRVFVQRFKKAFERVGVRL